MLKVKKRLDASRLLFTFAVFLKVRNEKAKAKGDSFRSYLTHKLQSQS